jgi:hypothetical protein
MFSTIFKWCQGRHTTFAIFFTIMGTLMAWFHRLDPSYVALIGAIQSLILAHSWKEDQCGNNNPNGGSPQC